jgi:hypothetical protein
MNSRLGKRNVRLRGLWPRDPGATAGHRQGRVDFSVARRGFRAREFGAALPRNDSARRDGREPADAQPRAVCGASRCCCREFTRPVGGQRQRRARGTRHQGRMNSRLGKRSVRLRGPWPRDLGATNGHRPPRVDFSVARRAFRTGKYGAALPRNDSARRDGREPADAQPRAVCGAFRFSSRGFIRPAGGQRRRRARGTRHQGRMNSRLGKRSVRLRGPWPRDPGATTDHQRGRVDFSVARKAFRTGKYGAVLP